MPIDPYACVIALPSGATITKNPLFWPKKSHFFGLKQHFGGMSGQLQGPIPYFECGGLRKIWFARTWSTLSSVCSRHHQKTVFLAKNKHVWFELYKSCYSQLGGECHISRIRPILDGIKPALSI